MRLVHLLICTTLRFSASHNLTWYTVYWSPRMKLNTKGSVCCKRSEREKKIRLGDTILQWNTIWLQLNWILASSYQITVQDACSTERKDKRHGDITCTSNLEKVEKKGSLRPLSTPVIPPFPFLKPAIHFFKFQCANEGFEVRGSDGVAVITDEELCRTPMQTSESGIKALQFPKPGLPTEGFQAKKSDSLISWVPIIDQQVSVLSG